MAIGHRSVRCFVLTAAVIGEHAVLGVNAGISIRSNPRASTSFDGAHIILLYLSCKTSTMKPGASSRKAMGCLAASEGMLTTHVHNGVATGGLWGARGAML